MTFKLDQTRDSADHRGRGDENRESMRGKLRRGCVARCALAAAFVGACSPVFLSACGDSSLQGDGVAHAAGTSTSEPRPSSLPTALGAEKHAEPRVVVLGEPKHDFGEQFERRLFSHAFRLRNASDAPIAFTGTSADCACTVARMNRVLSDASTAPYESGSQVAPGEMVEVIGTLDTTGKKNRVAGGIHIMADDPSVVVNLELSASVKQLFEIEPTVLDFGRFLAGSPREGKITVTSSAFGAFKLSFDPRVLPPELQVRVEPSKPGSNGRAERWEVSVVLGPGVPESSKLFYPIAFATDRSLVELFPDDEQKGLIEIKGFVKGAAHGIISVTPEYVSFGLIPAGNEQVSQKLVVENDDESFHLALVPANVVANLSAGSIALTNHVSVVVGDPTPRSQDLELLLDLTGVTSGPFRGTLEISTGHKGRPTLEIPFFGVVGAVQATVNPPSNPGSPGGVR